MMIAAAMNAAGYDWQTWAMGIMRSFISGGAGAVVGIVGPMTTDSKDFNFGNGLHHVLVSMMVGFFIMGVVHMAIFLQTHSGPDKLVTKTEEVSKTVPTEDGGIEQTKVTKTTLEKP